ncbi:hypothetical protein [Oecophyllibacter saccharovorans]|uniref:Uncharacterized protein n=1 Tax=Oecophyllibacter saccharovorans TaxID=2558360 RepID=A0A506UKM2_9PROT|nr:hypothetical protein [Oecophyllibacter saccharovorans]TPW33876.1 hypothetical protein E3202_04600 [Oecophyllibacter saccharovorans]
MTALPETRAPFPARVFFLFGPAASLMKSGWLLGAALTVGMLGGCSEHSLYCRPGAVHASASFAEGLLWPTWPVSTMALCPPPKPTPAPTKTATVTLSGQSGSGQSSSGQAGGSAQASAHPQTQSAAPARPVPTKPMTTEELNQLQLDKLPGAPAAGSTPFSAPSKTAVTPPS